MSATTQVPGIPFPLTPSGDAAWTIDPTGRVDVTAPARTDIFNGPRITGGTTPDPVLTAPTLLGLLPDGDFCFSARVTVDFGSTFDAGVLFLWFDDRHWAKLCFEYSPEGDPMVVSVVTVSLTDDANSFDIEGATTWLRVSRTDGIYAYHSSADGTTWRLVRAFALDAPDAATAHIGLEAQSPTGESCAVTFEDVRFEARRLADIRDGS